MLSYLTNLKLTKNHYIVIGGALVAAVLVWYYFLSGPPVPQGISKEELNYQNIEEPFNNVEEPFDYDDDYQEMPNLEGMSPQEEEFAQQQQQEQFAQQQQEQQFAQPQQQEPVPQGSFQQQEHFEGNEPMAANGGGGDFQAW